MQAGATRRSYGRTYRYEYTAESAHDLHASKLGLILIPVGALKRSYTPLYPQPGWQRSIASALTWRGRRRQ